MTNDMGVRRETNENVFSDLEIVKTVREKFSETKTQQLDVLKNGFFSLYEKIMHDDEKIVESMRKSLGIVGKTINGYAMVKLEKHFDMEYIERITINSDENGNLVYDCDIVLPGEN